ncbi:MAG: prepilin-type N-terminal cleavage/methylation domain-containing protein [Gammaproteobacteria bacterium]|nr:prepilin-type N-terminal cleavage/methylation domain-containing protein [Gammaproteobacteria bacterium]
MRTAVLQAAGFTYTEVLVAMVLIAVLLVPALDALRGGVQGGDIHAAQASQHYRVLGRMEDVLAQPFADLAAAADAAGSPTTIVAAYSDVAGTAERRVVYLARFDGDDADGDSDGFTGVDDDLIWIRVAIADTPTGLETLATP